MPNVPGRRWQDRRAYLDMDQGTAAEALGISKRTLQNIETNPGQGVSLEVIYRAARTYHTTKAWLTGEDEDEKAPEEKPEPTPRRAPSGDPTGPAPRKERKSGRGPRRDEMRAAS